MADCVEKVLCCVHAQFLRAAGALDAVGREGPCQSIRDRGVIFLVAWQRPLLQDSTRTDPSEIFAVALLSTFSTVSAIKRHRTFIGAFEHLKLVALQ